MKKLIPFWLVTATIGLSVIALQPTTAMAAGGCSPATLSTLTKGAITIGTDDPAYGPWFDSNTPANGKGFESAIAYAVAKKLGYPATKVKWVKAPFNSVIQPGKKPFDFDINEISITPERRKAVDFSSGYYDVAQAVVTVKGSAIAKATTISQLAKVKLGAAVGTTSLSTINSVVKPASKAAVYDTNDIAVAALNAGQIKGIVVDLPTAFYLAVSVKNAVLVGQFASKPGSEKFGLVLPKGSALTSCVTKSVDALRASGELKTLAEKWLANVAGAPVFKK
jgi:polar amino acid transport system substrate-binding protein